VAQQADGAHGPGAGHKPRWGAVQASGPSGGAGKHSSLLARQRTAQLQQVRGRQAGCWWQACAGEHAVKQGEHGTSQVAQV